MLIAGVKGPDEESAISVISLTRLHYGVIVAGNDQRAARVPRLAAVEFDARDFQIIEDLVDVRAA